MTARAARGPLRAAVACGIALVLVLALAPGVSAAEDLIEVDPAAVEVQTPAPGHTVEWTMTARNVADSEVPLSLEVAAASGPLLAGDHPLEIQLTAPDGDVLVAAAGDGISDLAERPLPVAELAPGAELVVRGEARMPAAAGDEYRGAEGALTLRFVATADDAATVPTTPGGALPWTGADVGALVLAALALVGFGIFISIVRRRRAA